MKKRKVSINALLSPFVFSKKELETIVNNKKDPTGCFQEMLDKINEKGGDGINILY